MRTSMTANQSRATMVLVQTALPVILAIVKLDIQAPSVTSLSKSASATLVRTEDAASTSSMATSVTAYQELQVLYGLMCVTLKKS